MTSTLSRTFSKTAEFADLFTLFDKLTSRRRNVSAIGFNEASSNLDDVASDTLPSDLEPVYRSLATLVGSRTWPREDMRETTAAKAAKTRPRSKTIAAVPNLGSLQSNNNVIAIAVDQDTTTTITTEDEEDEEDTESELKFPLDDQSRPFTFRMMLHKLYELEEWGKKVKDVLERSQSEFKPLAETNGTPKRTRAKTVMNPRLESRGAMDVNDTMHIHFSPVVKDKSPIKPRSRPRSHTTVFTTGGRGREIGVRPIMKPVVQKDSQGQDNVRATKKRCIGRRKSTTGMNENSHSSWSYIGSPAAVVSSEVDRRVDDAVLAVPKPKYGALQQGSGLQSRIINRCRISSADPTSATTGMGDVVEAATRRKVMSITTQ
ncbi:hypothetical protein D9758_008734 [Tetrapyrgos nigripes]|uniref:Uncharacterized protein n=1 Tax=Tetrapyrgos nigripes TaxID=182062 RepID=A0A8H5D5I7_9AGAR|nr:hypothetical protein D9758_008734 [Tetrapyrgos nigripes]